MENFQKGLEGLQRLNSLFFKIKNFLEIFFSNPRIYKTRVDFRGLTFQIKKYLEFEKTIIPPFRMEGVIPLGEGIPYPSKRGRGSTLQKEGGVEPLLHTPYNPTL